MSLRRALLILPLACAVLAVSAWAQDPPPAPQADANATLVSKEAAAEPVGEAIEGSFQPHESTEEQDAPAGGGLDEKASLDLYNIEVSEALRYLAQKAGINIVISKNIAGQRIQLLLNNVPISDILDIIMLTSGLAMEKRNDVYYFMTEAEYKDRFGRKFSDARKVKIFKIQYSVPEQVFSLFELLKSDIGRLLVDPESGTVLVIDSEDNIQKMQEALDAMEERKSVKVYDLKYAKALDVESRLKARLDGKKVGTAAADERTNQVIVETFPGRMREVDNLVASLDKKTREVLIDARIVKVTINDDLNAEIKWEGIFKQMSAYGSTFIGNHPFSALARTGTSFIDDFVNIPPTARPAQGAKNELTENLFLGTVGEDSFELLLNILKTYGDTKILSNPKLSVVNNQEAKIHVGEKQAYVTTTTTTGQTTTTTAEAVTFVDVGIQLNVTPTINADGFVTMKIKPEISSVVDFLTTPSGNQIPIIDSSLAETTVMVKDGVSIIIGGLRRDEKTENRKKVPIIGDIPVLGIPFNSFNTTTQHTELLIIITPHVVYGDTLVEGAGGRPAGDRPFLSYTDYPALEPLDLPGEPVVKREPLKS